MQDKLTVGGLIAFQMMSGQVVASHSAPGQYVAELSADHGIGREAGG